MIKVYIIERIYKSYLQDEINEFIKDKYVVDIKYQVIEKMGDEIHYAMILYKEKK